jgi:hypothetical protein
LACVLVVGSLHAAGRPDKATEGMVTRQDVEIVECLLPGQVRQVGGATYLSQRRPIRTSTADCRVRGGEYVAYDRADMKSALRVWLAAAEAGDADAQNTVGEIYERGLGGEPNYEAAVIWYGKAIAQKSSKAMFNMGTLYEQGSGVPRDKVKALNLYRQAWGLPEDSIMYESAARREQDELRSQLEKEVAERDAQMQLLQKQLESLQKQASAAAKTDSGSQSEVDALKKWIAQLEADKRKNTQTLAALPVRSPSASADSVPQIAPQADPRIVAGVNFGRYYALIIGNQNYQLLDKLQTPANDADRAARILRDRYGFTVQVLKDSDDVAMLKALNDLNAVLKPGDNLLIYYAGHGIRLKSDRTEAGYWLPVNSEPAPKDTFWVPNEQITSHLARLAATRILVVADSCYAGLLSTDPSYMFVDSKSGYTKDYITYKLPKRSRLLISSGGDNPVLDTGGGSNSVFARAFLDELESNQAVLATPDLFGRVFRRVEAGASRSGFKQKPEFKSIKGAGHEVGDFFFVPRETGRRTPST